MKRPLLFMLIIASSICKAQPVERIITAGSAMTETVCALGLQASIVASDRTSLFPPEIQALPSIGYRTNISAEGIVSLKPTLVIAEKDYVDEAVLTQIQSAGIKTIVIKRSYNLEGTRSLIRQIAQALGRVAEGEKVIARIEKQLADVSDAIKRSKLSSPKVLCVYNRGTSSVDVAGTNTFSSILPFVNAVNPVTGVEGYKPLNAEALIAANPDYILFFESGLKSLGGADGALKIAGVAETNAGRQKKIIALDGIKMSNFGPRLGEAVTELSVLLYPEMQQKP